jgi:predicted component of type VI protein secretion system
VFVTLSQPSKRVAKSSTMERIQVLIAKLKEQADQNADPSQLMITVQLLQQELMSSLSTVRTLGTSKVSVTMPSNMQVASSTYEKYAPRPVVAEKMPEPVIAQPEPVAEPAIIVKMKEPVVAPAAVVQQNGQLDMTFDHLMEIPTLSQQVQPKEVNAIAAEGASLNDKLKQSKAELGETLKESPVKDLRKAIGINDRFLFINDLFRGDEAMYERSIKTINSFNIFPEAEYWISRELKVKLGWNTEHPSVAHFDQLVKRRFS